MLYPLCAEAIKSDVRTKLLNKKHILSDECFGCAVISENVLTALRRQIKKTEGVTISEEELVKQIKKLIPQFKDFKISRRFTRKNSCRKINSVKEDRVEQQSEETK